MPKPGERYWSLIEPFWLPLNESWDAGLDEFLSKFATVPQIAGDLYAAHWCQAEICNGGFYQFFSNTTGLLAPEAMNGFRHIGIDRWANLLTEAMAFFGAPYPRDRSKRCRRLPTDWDPFGVLDTQFYDWLHADIDPWERAADAYAERGATEKDGGGM